MYTRVCHAHAVSQTHISNTRSYDDDDGNVAIDIDQTQFKSKNQIKYFGVYLYITFYGWKRSRLPGCERQNERNGDEGQCASCRRFERDLNLVTAE